MGGSRYQFSECYSDAWFFKPTPTEVKTCFKVRGEGGVVLVVRWGVLVNDNGGAVVVVVVAVAMR